MDNIFTSNDLDLLDTSSQIPRPIYYSWLSNLPKNLFQNITPDWPFFGTLEFYLALIPIIS